MKKALSLVLAAALALGLLAVTASAATIPGPVTLDIGALARGANNHANPAQVQWRVDGAYMGLWLDPGCDFDAVNPDVPEEEYLSTTTLTGSNSNCLVMVDSYLRLVLDNVNIHGVDENIYAVPINSPALDFVFGFCYVILQGNNVLTGENNCALKFGHINNTFKGSGALTATGAAGCPGIGIGESDDGFVVTGGAHIKAVGGAGAPGVGDPDDGGTVFFDIGENGKVTITNNSGVPETHYFQKADAADGRAWNVTGASYVSVYSSDPYRRIEVTIPAGGTGVVSLGGATEPPHTHSFGAAWGKDATGHWHACACGEKSGFAAHTPGGWIVDTAATATTDGSKHKQCTACGYTTATEVIPATGGGEEPASYVGLFGIDTEYPSNLWNWFMFVALFGWLWMWFI
ncbi:MAG: hypothetical protein LBB75_07060 [Oscillospiraceae bacterium]|nr:hypothetical protein [Oscillospiraceae bacterium]